MSFEGDRKVIYSKYVKRILDFSLALIGLIVAVIPMGIVAIAIKLDSKGPVVFKQDRIGYKGKVYQFMVNGQTGKVSGKAPISPIRVAIAILIGIVIIGLLAVLVMGGDSEISYYM